MRLRQCTIPIGTFFWQRIYEPACEVPSRRGIFIYSLITLLQMHILLLFPSKLPGWLVFSSGWFTLQ